MRVAVVSRDMARVLPALRFRGIVAFVNYCRSLRLPCAALLPEGAAHNLGGHPFAPHLHIESIADLCGGGGEIGGTDGYTERGAHGPAPYQVHLAVLIVHRISVAGKPPALELKADQFAGDPARLLGPECAIPSEGTTFVQLHDPA